MINVFTGNSFVVLVSYTLCAAVGVWIGMTLQRARLAREMQNMHDIVSKLQHPVVIAGEIKSEK